MPTNGETNRERDIFEKALDFVSAEERVAYLKEACGEDVALLDRLRALLQEHEQGEGFLPAEPAGALPLASVAEKPPLPGFPGVFSLGRVAIPSESMIFTRR